MYALSFFLLYPKFECDGIEDGSDEYKKKCIPEYFCDSSHNITWHIIDDDKVSIDNWIKKYDMTCDSHYLISSFGMAMFAAWAVGSAFLPPISDKYGRKWFYVGCMLC